MASNPVLVSFGNQHHLTNAGSIKLNAGDTAGHRRMIWAASVVNDGLNGVDILVGSVEQLIQALVDEAMHTIQSDPEEWAPALERSPHRVHRWLGSGRPACGGNDLDLDEGYFYGGLTLTQAVEDSWITVCPECRTTV